MDGLIDLSKNDRKSLSHIIILGHSVAREVWTMQVHAVMISGFWYKKKTKSQIKFVAFFLFLILSIYW